MLGVSRLLQMGRGCVLQQQSVRSVFGHVVHSSAPPTREELVSVDDSSPRPYIKVKWDIDFLKSRGDQLRRRQNYTPPANVKVSVLNIYSRLHPGNTSENWNECAFVDGHDKFQILVECMQHFNHAIPNSQLHKISTLGDVIMYFETPVNVACSYDNLAKADLPPNLHIQQEYVRFHPETDTMFGGVSAFPQSSTIVTGLKYKKKYKGYNVSTEWMNKI